MGKLKVGFIGLGHVVQVCHLPGMRTATEAQAVAGAELREDLRRDVCRQWSISPYQDFRDMLRKEDLDIACVTTGPRFAPAVTEQVAEAGVNVLVEKPMALTLDGARSMIDACQRNGVKLFYGESFRFFPTCRKAKEMINAGQLGEVSLVLEVLVGGSGAKGFEAYGIYPSGAPGSGPMGLTDHGIHLADLFRWFTSSEVEWVFGRGVRAGQPPTTELLTMKARGGAIGQFVCNEGTFFSDLPEEGIFSLGPYESAGGPAWDPHPVSLRIHGTEGALRVYPYPNKLFCFDKDGQRDIAVLDRPHPAQFGLQIDSFARSVRDDEAPEIAGEDGYRALQIILAAYESFEHLRIISM
ncbi:MAG: Gfo/Idh/MocA family oxidoreductase [Candidatus Thermoplasmatota archaeon]|nr:Gfo/Idh/MocA family oxidoreductase [Candidatus Thermoplasmatota archaeon]